MTLILASIRPTDVVLTSDSRSILMENGVVTAINDSFQKIFPIPDHPAAICHMGENKLAGATIAEFLKRFIKGLNTGNFTILEIADQLRQYTHPAIRARLKALGNPEFGCNLWVVGFTMQDRSPRMVEVFWQRKETVLFTEEREFSPVFVVPGGNGKLQIRPVDWHSVDGKTVAEVQAYHQSLMAEAMQAKVQHNSVGGRIQELVITPAAWKWTQPPPKSS